MASSSSLSARWKRRAWTIPSYAIGLAVFVALAPLTVVLALLADLARRRSLAALRIWAMLGAYLAINVGSQILLAGAWLSAGLGRNRAALRRRTYALQAGWIALLHALVTRLWRLRWTIEGDGQVEPAPIVLLIRHASLLDTLVPTMYVSRAHGIPLRFVLKRELLVDPCLDIAGHFLVNHFVARGSDDARAEIEAITRLARGLEPGEGLIIYPEGTRFDRTKRERIIARLDRTDPRLAARARALQHTLLPRIGGVRALLDGAPEADVVVCAHVGLGGFATLADLWSGELIGRTIAVRFWRHAAADLPTDEAGRQAWLHARWAELDAWIAERKPT